jgi:hypothetical protein
MIAAGSLVTDALVKFGLKPVGLQRVVLPVTANLRSRPGAKCSLPHQWDEEDNCLEAGSTELSKAHDISPTGGDSGQPPGRWVVLVTKPTDPSIKARTAVVRLITVEDTFDLVLPPQPPPITRLVWQSDQATTFEMDMTVLEVHANIIPAVSGATQVRQFTIGPSANPVTQPSAIEREGPDQSVAYLFSLPDSDTSQLVFLGSSTDDSAPEIRLVELITGLGWTWRRELLGTNSSLPTSKDFRLDDGFWRRVVGYQRIGTEIVQLDYATGDGKTVRFGDGEFWAITRRRFFKSLTASVSAPMTSRRHALQRAADCAQLTNRCLPPAPFDPNAAPVARLLKIRASLAAPLWGRRSRGTPRLSARRRGFVDRQPG